MIPIVSIFNLISALFFGSIALKLYFSYQKNKDEKLGDFFKVFLFFTILLALIASPGLIFSNREVIGLIYAIYPLFAFLALSYLGIITLKLMGWKKIKEIFFKGIIGVAFLITFFNLLNWSPARVYYETPFVYWEDTRGVIMNVILGVIYSLGLLMLIIFFLVQGFKSSERFVRMRSILIAGGLLSLALTTIVNFIIGALAKIYITSLIATIFNILADIIKPELPPLIL